MSYELEKQSISHSLSMVSSLASCASLRELGHDSMQATSRHATYGVPPKVERMRALRMFCASRPVLRSRHVILFGFSRENTCKNYGYHA